MPPQPPPNNQKIINQSRNRNNYKYNNNKKKLSRKFRNRSSSRFWRRKRRRIRLVRRKARVRALLMRKCWMMIRWVIVARKIFVIFSFLSCNTKHRKELFIWLQSLRVRLTAIANKLRSRQPCSNTSRKTKKMEVLVRMSSRLLVRVPRRLVITPKTTVSSQSVMKDPFIFS